jgi:hypothetical protein
MLYLVAQVMSQSTTVVIVTKVNFQSLTVYIK